MIRFEVLFYINLFGSEWIPRENKDENSEKDNQFGRCQKEAHIKSPEVGRLADDINLFPVIKIIE